MKFQAIFFVLFALASSFLSLCAVGSADNSTSSNMTTLASLNSNASTAQPPPVHDSNNTMPANQTGSNPEVNNNGSTSPTTVATTASTTTTPSSAPTSNSTVNQAESRNTTEAPPQNLVDPRNTTAATTTTTQSPVGVSDACLEIWRNQAIDDFCPGNTNESVAKCDERERVILYNHECWVLRAINSTSQNVSKECLQRVTECLFKAAGSSADDIRNNFCRQDKSSSDCFTRRDNSSFGCTPDEYQVFRKVSDCSSARRVAEACTLIVLLASVVALALTSE